MLHLLFQLQYSKYMFYYYYYNLSIQGGGSMALVFYQPLPHGRKAVYFLSKTNPNYYICQVAIDENPHTLSCAIPSKFDDNI